MQIVRDIALGILTAVAVGVYGQTNVSTVPGPRVLLIEEFTGQSCVYCPQGHRVCHDLMVTNPGRIVTVNIHAGEYAVPGAGAPDFRTDEGEYLLKHFEVTGFPSGLLGRLAMDNGRRIVFPPNCATQVHELLDATAAVNVWNNAVYDNDTRTLSVDVEAYFIEDCPDARLTVYVLQNDIEGPQMGSGNNTSYLHAHMLRNVLTEPLGDLIETSTAGTLYRRTLSMEVPEKLKGVTYKPEDMQVVAFVTNANEEVMNVSEAYLQLKGVEPPVRAVLSQPLVPIDTYWNYDYLECILENRNDVALTDAEFEMTLAKNTATVSWTGEIAPHSAAQLRIPVPEALAMPETYKRALYRLVLTKANGAGLSTDNRISGNISSPEIYPGHLIFTLVNDKRPEHITWRLYDCADGSLVREFDNFDMDGTLRQEVMLPPGDYCLDMYDAWGDASLDTPVQATIADADGNLLYDCEYIQHYGMRHFFNVAADAGVDSAVIDEELAISVLPNRVAAVPDALLELYSTEGVLLRSGRGSIGLETLQSGIYVVKATAADKSAVTKISIK